MSAGLNVAQTMLDAGLVGILLSMLKGYESMADPKAGSRCGIWYGAMFALEVCLGPEAARAFRGGRKPQPREPGGRSHGREGWGPKPQPRAAGQ